MLTLHYLNGKKETLKNLGEKNAILEKNYSDLSIISGIRLVFFDKTGAATHFEIYSSIQSIPYMYNLIKY
jgi:hypothetical protein